MKVSLKWLSDYVEVPQDIKEFCDRLDLTGTGVEGVERTGDVFDGVVVGHVLTCVDHPDSDHMHVTTVDVGAEEPVQIVCVLKCDPRQGRIPLRACRVGCEAPVFVCAIRLVLCAHCHFTDGRYHS